VVDHVFVLYFQTAEERKQEKTPRRNNKVKEKAGKEAEEKAIMADTLKKVHLTLNQDVIIDAIFGR